MKNNDYTNIINRMNKYENNIYKYRILLLIQGMLFISFVILGATFSSRTIEAEKIIIKDRAGIVRSEYGMLDPNTPGFKIFDNNGNNRLEISIYNNIPFINVNDRNEERRISMNVSNDGPVIGLSDNEGIMRLGMSVPHQLPGIYLYDKNKTGRVVLVYSDQLDESGLFINDRNENPIYVAP